MSAPPGFNPNASLLEQNATAPIQAFRGGGISAKPFYEAILRALALRARSLPPDATITKYAISVEDGNFVLKLRIKGKKQDEADDDIFRKAREFLIMMEARNFLRNERTSERGSELPSSSTLLSLQTTNELPSSSTLLSLQTTNELPSSSTLLSSRATNELPSSSELTPFDAKPLPPKKNYNKFVLAAQRNLARRRPTNQSTTGSSGVPPYLFSKTNFAETTPRSENALQGILGSNHPRGTSTDSKYESEYESKSRSNSPSPIPPPSERSQANIDEEEINAVVAAVQKEEEVRASRVNKLIANLKRLQTNVSVRRQRPSTAGRALTSNEETKLTTLMKNNQNLTMNVEKLISEIKTGTANPE